MTIPIQTLVPATLMLTILSCWCVPKRYTGGLIFATLAAGLWCDVITAVALPSLALLAISGWGAVNGKGWLRPLATLLFILTSIILACHWLPGFHNILIWNHETVKADSVPFTLFYNVDKPWIGLVILLVCTPLLKSSDQWRQAIWRSLLPIAVMLPVVFGVGMLIGFVRWQPAWTELGGWFLLNNLVFTAVAEEAFFRGFIQESLSEHLSEQGSGFSYGKEFALLITAILFGLAHYAGGPVYMMLAALAGLFYGWSYMRSGSIEMAILTHWFLNAGHFIFFSYPLAV